MGEINAPEVESGAFSGRVTGTPLVFCVIYGENIKKWGCFD